MFKGSTPKTKVPCSSGTKFHWYLWLFILSCKTEEKTDVEKIFVVGLPVSCYAFMSLMCSFTEGVLPDERIVSRYMKQSRRVTVGLISGHWLHHPNQLPPVMTTESQHWCCHRLHKSTGSLTDASCFGICLLHLPPPLHPLILGNAPIKHLPPPFLQHVSERQCGHDGECLFQQEVDLSFYEAKKAHNSLRRSGKLRKLSAFPRYMILEVEI